MSHPPQSQPEEGSYSGTYGSYPAAPPPGYGPGYGPGLGQYPTGAPVGGPPPSSGSGRGLALAAIITGGVALLGCWIPFLNILSVLAGLAAVVLGIVVVTRARRGRAAGAGLAWGGLAMGAAAVVVAVVVDVAVGMSIARSSDGSGAPLSAPSSTVAPSEPTPDDSAEPQPAGPGEENPLGQAATVGDYTVAVTGVDPDADAAVQQANQFNDPPTGRYVLVELTVTYNGTEEGTPWIDLETEFLGTDARNYRQCYAVTPESGLELPTLRQGGTATYQTCFDVPADAIAGGAVSVHDQMDYLDSEPAQVWSTGTTTSGTTSGT